MACACKRLYKSMAFPVGQIERGFFSVEICENRIKFDMF